MRTRTLRHERLSKLELLLGHFQSDWSKLRMMLLIGLSYLVAAVAMTHQSDQVLHLASYGFGEQKEYVSFTEHVWQFIYERPQQ